MINPSCIVSGSGSGVLKQATSWALGLRSLGHEVLFMNPQGQGEILPFKAYDVVHFYHYGYWLEAFTTVNKPDGQIWCFSPIIDSMASRHLYGALARLPSPKLVSFGPSLLRKMSLKTTVLVRSSFEKRFMKSIAPKAKIEEVPLARTVQHGEVQRPSRDLPKKFVLFVGGIFSPRKNVVRLIRACELLNLNLVLVGNERDTPAMRAVNRECERTSIAVIKLGFVPDEQIRWLYKHCDVFCLPSLIEGVGQVAMEALYYGAKVVVTGKGGARDYLGEHATYVDPLKLDSISKGIRLASTRPVDLGSAKEFLKKYDPICVARSLLEAYGSSE